MGATIRPRARLRRSPSAKRRLRGAEVVLRHADRDRHREPDDGRGAREGPHHAGQLPRASPRSRSSAACSTRWARASTAPAPTSSTSRARDELAPVRSRDHPRPHRGRHVHGRGRGDRRRRAARGRAARGPRGAGRRSCARPASSVEREGAACASRATAPLTPVDITTAPHPGFPTDMQAQFMVLMCLAEGQSVHHRDDLREPLHARAASSTRMGADIDVDGHTAIVHGASRSRAPR